MDSLPEGASELPDDFLRRLIELDELGDARDDSPEPGEMASVCAPLKPKPHLNLGAIALPEPELPEI